MRTAKRLLRRIVRSVIPESRRAQLRFEITFWTRWFRTKGLQWPQDHADRFDPQLPLQPWVATHVDQLDQSEVEILDVGSGPLTKLGKVHPSKRLSITAVDLLADEYNRLLAQFGLDPLIRTRSCDAETLSEMFGNRSFDVVHAENSMDHTRDAIAALRQMLSVARPGGLVLLFHMEHEGRNEDYAGLHHWDFLCEDGQFIVAGPGPRGARHNITQMFSDEADIECRLDDGCVNVVMRKQGERASTR